MKRNVFYILSVCLLISFNIRADVKQISISPLRILNQLPSNSVQRVFQDKDGFLWLGTLDGLCRYDGYSVLVFRSNFHNPGLLSDNEITSIAEDHNNQLWIGTKSGMDILDKRTYTIRPFEAEELQGVEIKCILVAADGCIWVGTSRQLFCYNPDMTLHKKYDSSLPIIAVNSIYEDLDGDIWVCLWNNGLHKYDRERDTFIRYPSLGNSNNPFVVFQDNKKQHWIGTWWSGFYAFNPESKDSMYVYQPVDRIDASFENSFFSITQDDKYGYLWTVSNSTLRAFEQMPDGNLRNVDISYLFKNHNNILSQIIKDKSGNLWIASFSEGVLAISFERPVLQNYALPQVKEGTGFIPRVSVVYEDADKNIWMNLVRLGLTVFEPATNTVRNYKDFPVLKSKFNDVVRCISGFRSLPGEIWIGMESGTVIYSLKKENGNVFIYDQIDLNKQINASGKPRFFHEDSQDNIWIVTTQGVLIKKAGKRAIELVSLSLGTITGITEDVYGNIWVGTQHNGIYRISLLPEAKGEDKFEIENFTQQTDNLPSDNIRAICADKKGCIWFSTKEENVMKYNIADHVFHDLSETLNSNGDGIRNIIADDYGHIWFTMGKQVVEYNPENNTARTYSEADGLIIDTFLPNSYFKNPAGKLFFGGNKGISVLSPSKELSDAPRKIRVNITDVKINNHSVFTGNDNRKLNMVGQTLLLEPGDKNIEIDFSSLNYTFPTKIRFAYKLDGVDDDWVYTDSERQFAIYNKIKKGKHMFHLKATDENGIWSNEIYSFKIQKRAAFYETWWAFAVYFILFVAGVYLVYRIIKNRIKLRNDLRIAQIEKEKSEEVAQTKLRYFTNISHDFLTPLTIMSCLIDDAEITYKEKIPHFDSMRTNIGRLKRLLQQVLDFRKMESGNMKLKISHGDIVPFIRDLCYTNFLPLIKKNNINFSFTTSPEQMMAYFDADKLDKITYNILSNAFKYTPSNGEIKIKLSRQEKQGHSYLCVRISDSGIGIAKEDLENIFTRFYTNKNGEINETNGIGLSLTKDLLELHHGSIRVESELGKGSTFEFELPIDRDSYSVSELGGFEQLPVKEKSADASLLYKVDFDETDVAGDENKEISVLVVDDNDELLNLMKNILSKHYTVFVAQNGVEALSVVHQNDIHIIVSDVMMPEMDGLELTRNLKKDIETSHIPVVLLTAKNSTEDRIECYNAGADGYIAKPFELKILEARINNFVANKREKQEEYKKNADFNVSMLEYQLVDEQILNNAIKIVEGRLTDPDLNVVSLSEEMHMSKSSFYRKIKNMTGLSPNEFIRNVRLKHACQLLKNQSISVAEVAYATGFSDPKYFSVCFKNEFNITPSDYQRSQYMTDDSL